MDKKSDAYNNIDEIRSDEVQEILGHIPHWMIRYGIAILFAFIILLLSASWIVKYPDYIEGNIVIKTVHPPIKLVSKSTGKLKNIQFKDGDLVKKGDFIAEVENPTPSASIVWLDKKINELKAHLNLQKNLSSPAQFSIPDSIILGQIHSKYNLLIENAYDLNTQKTNNFHKQKITNLKKQIEYYSRLITISNRKIKLGEKEFANAESNYNSQKELFNKGIISQSEFFSHENIYVQNKHQLEDLKQAYVQNNISRTEYQKQLDDFIFSQNEKERKLTQQIELGIKDIENEIESWKQTHVIVAPQSGILNYLQPLHENLFITQGEQFFAISTKNTNYNGVINVSTIGIGKIKVGQKVYVKLDNYPYQQYGQIIGEVTNIHHIPVLDQQTKLSSNYIDVKFDNIFTTTYHKEINLNPENIGFAQIVTEDRRILERIFGFLREKTGR